ncbi:hypothetical protein [Kitasatospora sp. NPDC001683]
MAEEPERLRESGAPVPGAGVGGPALTAGTRADAARALRRAVEEVTAWSHRPIGPESFASFPYRAVVGYYRQVGKAAVAPELVALLRGLRIRIGCAGGGRPWSSPDAWLFDRWLPLTFTDQPMAYDTYAGHELLQIAHWEADSAEHAEDLLMMALLADLATVELDALALPEPTGRQRTRTVAVLQALARLGGYAPAAVPDAVSLEPLRAVVAAASGNEALVRAGRETVAALRAEVPAGLRRAVDIGLLPVTTVHDEHMFIRSIQLFERIFARVAGALTDAIGAVRAGRPSDAAAVLSAAADRLTGATPALYRVLTTIPPETFAVIRDHTHGASAIQSRPYQMIELVSAKRADGPYAMEKGPMFTVPATLQEEFLERAGGWDTAEARRLQEAMLGLDAAWRSMKRTHWGVTLKIIGKVSGTGGTTGADYLKAAANIELFPMLAAA